MSIFLNGFRIELSASTFTAYEQKMPDNHKLRSIREQHKHDWFLYWQNGLLYGIPKIPNPTTIIGKPITLECEQNFKLLVDRINNLLPAIFPQYAPISSKPFRIIAQKQELVEEIRKQAEFQNLPLLEKFQIIPRYTLECKLIELRPEEVFIGLFLRLGTKWKITASLSELKQNGVNLKGLYVVRRQPKQGERYLVGKIHTLEAKTIHLSESFDNIAQINEDEVCLEGSKASFAHCLKTLLGYKYQAFEKERETKQGKLLIGTGQHETLEKMREYLSKKFPIALTSDLKIDIRERIEINNNASYQTFTTTSPVDYCFDAARTKRDRYAWCGISNYGPFSRDIFSKKSPEILVFFPDTIQGKVEHFLNAFREGISIKQKEFNYNGYEELNEKSYYRGGFAKIFCLTNPTLTLQKISWLENNGKSPAIVYKKTIEQTLSNRERLPDAAIVIILDEHSNLPDKDNPYLHAKALLLMAGVPVQEIRYSTITKTNQSLQYILQNFSLALYAKLTGQPWTVDQDQTINDELIIGIGTSELSNSRFEKRQRFVGITTVFRGDGNYLLSNLSKECSYDEYPEVLRESTVSILREIKQRNGWQTNDTIRLVFHTARPFKKVNIAKIINECVKEVGKEQNIEFAFLTISEDHPFIVFDTSQTGIDTNKGKGEKKGIYAPERGKIIQIGKYTRLLCTNSPPLIKKTTTPLPSPLLIRLDSESNYRDLTYLSEQVLKFTALSWRSTFPVAKPVSIYYSELIANLLGRLRNVINWSSTMLNINLRASKWFL